MMTTSIATSATTIIFKTLSITSNRTLSRPVWSPMQRNGRTQAPEEEGDRPELGTTRASSVQLVQGSTPHLPCVLPSKLHGHYMGFGARDARAPRNSLTRVSHLAVWSRYRTPCFCAGRRNGRNRSMLAHIGEECGDAVPEGRQKRLIHIKGPRKCCWHPIPSHTNKLVVPRDMAAEVHF
jgi:hypothetical protein